MFLRHLIHWHYINIQVKLYGDQPWGTPPSGEFNTRGVAEYSDCGPIERYISVTEQDRSATLILITERKSHYDLSIRTKFDDLG